MAKMALELIKYNKARDNYDNKVEDYFPDRYSTNISQDRIYLKWTTAKKQKMIKNRNEKSQEMIATE